MLKRGFATGVCLLGLAGCDAQATPDYPGAVLLALSGNVEIDSGRERGELIPALAFYNSETGYFHIQEVEVEGQFPSGFTLRVYAPPPAAAIAETRERPASAVAYLTAVTPEHPDTILVPKLGGSGICSASEGPEPSAPVECEIAEQWCLPNATACYSERRLCPAHDSPVEDCEILSQSGDPALREDPWEHFAGIAEEYAIMYLVNALPADHPVALEAGLPALDAGYHLVRMPERTAEAELEVDTCTQDARRQAVDEYNKTHGTMLAWENVFGPCASGGPIVGTAGSDDPGTPAPEPVTPEATCGEWPPDAAPELTTLDAEARIALGCNLILAPTPVESPESASISVRIGPDVRPPW